MIFYNTNNLKQLLNISDPESDKYGANEGRVLKEKYENMHKRMCTMHCHQCIFYVLS